MTYLLILVIAPPLSIMAGFLAFPVQTAHFFNFQVTPSIILSEYSASHLTAERGSDLGGGGVLGASTEISTKPNAIFSYLGSVLGIQAEATVKMLRALTPTSVSGIVLPSEVGNEPNTIIQFPDTGPPISPSTNGSPGSPGATGSTGPKGDKGDRGDQGIAGATGPTGSTGAAGSGSGTGDIEGVTAGNGLAGGGITGTVNLDIALTTSGTTGSTSSNSGLEVSPSGLTLLKGCADNEILKYSDIGGWVCSADSTGGSPTFDSIASGTNTTASMLVGTGGSLNFLGSGTINASSLGGATFASPGAIGGGTANAATFTGLTATSGLTVSSGSVSFPAGSITNAALANSSLTVTAGTGLTGGGLVSLGGSTTLSLPSVGTAGTYGSALSIPVFTTDAQGRLSSVTLTTIAGLTNSNLSGSAGITNANLANSSISLAGNTGSGSVALGGTQTFTGAGITNITVSGSTFTLTSTEADTLASVTGRGASTATSISTTGGASITSNGTLTASNGLTLTTGALNLTGTSGALSISGLSASSLSTGANALTFTSSNFSTTATGINTTNIGTTTPGTGAFTTLSTSGQLTSTVTTGTAPLVIASTTNVANLNASSLNGATFASPGAIGGGTVGSGTFTTLTGNTSITDGGLTTAGVVTNTSAGVLGTLAGTTTTVLHGNVAGLPTYSSITGSDLASNITISTTGNISTTGSGTITSAGLLTGSNGLTLTTGALNLTSTSGSISSTGLTGLTQTLSTGTAALTAPTLNLNTASTGSTALGNATGTFALSSNGGLNVTTVGALTGVASIDTIGTTATAITFVGAGSLASTGANSLNLDGGTTGVLNLNNTSSGDILIGGGSASTGCTIANATGNITCTGALSGSNFSGSTSGTNTGDITLSAIGATPNVNGATLTGQVLNLQPADGSFSGVVTTGTQTLAGAKTLSSLLTASNGLTLTTGALNLTGTSGALTLSGLSASSFSTGANTLAFTSSNFSTTATGINSTVIGATTAAAGTFTTLTANTSITRGSDTIIDFTGNGLTLSTGSLIVNLPTATDGLSSTTSSGSGIEALSAGLTLLQGCSNSQILKWNETTDLWECSADSTGGSPTFDSIATGTNTTATMTVGTGGTLTFSGSGVVNASTLGSATFAAPGAIGGGTAASGTFTSLTSTGLTNLGTSGASNVNIATAGTGSTTIGNATGTFALTSSGGLNVTTAGALTGVASIDTIGTSATAITFAGAGTISSTSTSALTLDSGTTGNVNLGTGASAKTITLGNSTSTTGLNFDTGTNGINFGDNANTKTIDIGGVTNSGTDTINIATNSTAADAITIGNSNASTTIAMTGGNDWSISAAGQANFATTLGSGLTNCTGANQKLQWNSSTNLFSCVNENVLQTRSFNDPADVAWAANNTTELFTTPASRANITPTSASNSVLVMVSVQIASGGTTDAQAVGAVRSATGSTATCASGQVDGDYGAFFTENSTAKTATSVFLHSPATTSNVSYTLCSRSTSVLGSTPTKIDATVTLIEVTNSTADLAEIYSTNDKSIAMGDVVSLDSALRAGVKKTSGRYDSAVLGVVSTAPALTIGGTDGEGVSAVPVALSGRVPVRVSTENGSIKAGDYLTSSTVPGVAMKATKAGAVIGNAMSDYSGEGVGLVLVFIKNGESSGTNLADLIPGLDSSSSTYMTQILANLIQNNEMNSNPVDLSEINTDRLIAGLEIITPKVTTQDILVTGNATISGTLTADTINAKKINGLEVITNQLSLLSDQVAGVSTSSAEPTKDEGKVETNILSLISKAIADLYKNTAEFFGKVIFRGDVNFAGTPTFNSDTVGRAIIKQGADVVDIEFKKEYASQPVVNVNINLVGSIKADDIPKFGVYDVTAKGFKIKLSQAAGSDLSFSWIALAVNDDNVSTSNLVSTPSISPTPTALPVTSPTVEPSPVVSPSASPSPSAVPSIAPSDIPSTPSASIQ